MLWSLEEEKLLLEYWGERTRNQLVLAFPLRTQKSIHAKAQRLLAEDKRRNIVRRNDVSWTSEEKLIIKTHWRQLDKRILRKIHLPHRSIASIEGQARRLGLTKERKPRIARQFIIKQLLQERKLLGWTRLEVANRSGYSECQIAEWERGDNMDVLQKLIDWAETLGFDLVLIPKDTE